jgi:hypothetical protein
MAPGPPQLRQPPLLGDTLLATGFQLAAPPYPQSATAFAIFQLQLDKAFLPRTLCALVFVLAAVHFPLTLPESFRLE